MTTIISLAIADQLPPSPPFILAALQEQLSPDVSASPLHQRLRDDPAICLDLLRRFASNETNPLRNFDERLAQLDASALRNLLHQQAARLLLHPIPDSQAQSLKQLWAQHVRILSAAYQLGALLAPGPADELLLTLQLLPVGQLYLLQRHADRYPALLAAATSPNELAALERTQFGHSGHQLTAALLRQQAPQSLACDAVAHLLKRATELQGAAPLIQRAALAYRLAIPGPATDDCFQLASALGFDRDTTQALKLQVSTAADQAESDCLRDLDLFDPNQLPLHLACLVRFPPGASSEPELGPWSALVSDCHRLIAGGRQVLFQPQPASSRLQAVAACQLTGTVLEELQSPLGAEGGLLSRAAQNGTPLIGEEPAAALIDQQLLRLLDATTLWYLPLHRAGQVCAVLVTTAPPGYSNETETALAMAYLARHCNECLSALQRQQERLEDHTAALQQHVTRASADLLHDAATPLSISQNYLEVLSRRLPEDNPAHPAVAAIKTEVDHLQQLISRWQAMPSATGSTDRGDLNAVVQQHLHRLAQDDGVGPLRITVELAPEPLPVECASQPLRQLVQQLLHTALAHQSANGEPHLRTRHGVNLNGRQHVELMIRSSSAEPLSRAELWRPTIQQARKLNASFSYRTGCQGAIKLVVLFPCPPSANEKE